MVINTINEEMSFCDYYSQWVDVYKEGAIREVTMKKYKLTQAWLRKLIPDLKLSEFDGSARKVAHFGSWPSMAR